MDSQLLILPVSIDSPRDRAFPDEIMIAQAQGLGEALGCCTLSAPTSERRVSRPCSSTSRATSSRASRQSYPLQIPLGGAGSRRLVACAAGHQPEALGGWAGAGRGRIGGADAQRRRARAAADAAPPAILWKISARFGNAPRSASGSAACWRPGPATGSEPFTATKILWLRRHHPDLTGASGRSCCRRIF
jgi:hypothetical protein